MVVTEGRILNFISNHKKPLEIKPKAFAHKMEGDYQLIQTGKKVLSVMLP